MAHHPANPPARHAIARSTGATTLARKLGDGWTIECLSHGATTAVPGRSAAWLAGSHPQDYCATCAKIVAGTAGRVTGERVAIPEPDAKPTPKAKAAPRTRKAAKPAA